MESHIGALAPLVLCILLTALHSLFTLGEVSLLRSQSAVLRRPEFETKIGSKFSLKLINQPAPMAMMLRFGIIFSVIGFLSIIFGYEFLKAVESVIGVEQQLPIKLYVTLSLVFLMHLLLGSVAPAAVAVNNPERTLMIVAPLLYLLMLCFRPVLYPLGALSKLILGSLRIEPMKSLEFQHSTEDLGRIFDGSGDDSDVDEEEQVMLRGVVEFGNTVAREVMTPRADLVSVPIGAKLDEVVQIITESGLSRFPVQGESIDDIKGVLLAKDILDVLRDPELSSSFSVAGLMRQTYFIPDSKPIDDLLKEFKRRKLHLAIVLDEHGGVDGIVTLEDLLEEIVGDIFDESDTPEEDFAIESSGDVLVDGGMLVFELNEHFDLGIPEGDYDTIAGFVFTSLGRMPNVGDKISISDGEVVVVTPKSSGLSVVAQNDGENSEDGNYVLIIVEEVDSNRISLVRIKSAESSEIDETKQSRAAS